MNKEYIYLAIILLYSAYKIIVPIWHGFGIYKLFGFKRVVISGYVFIIRKMAPLDFIDEDNGFPMGVFDYKKGTTLFEQMSGKDNKKETPEEMRKRIEIAIKICEKGIVYYPGNLKTKDFFDPHVSKRVAKIALKIYDKLIDYNFNFLKKVHKLNKNHVLHIAELCAKFGKHPHEHLKHSEKFTDLESYLIDEFFYNTLLSKLNEETAKINSVRKKK